MSKEEKALSLICNEAYRLEDALEGFHDSLHSAYEELIALSTKLRSYEATKLANNQDRQ